MVKSLYKIFKKYGDVFLLVAITGVSLLHLSFALRTNLYFSVDDFAVLAYIRNHGALNIFFSFIANGDVFGFRKVLGYEVFKMLFDFYKVNPLPYILVNHIFQLANLFLLYFVIKKLTNNLAVSFFYTVIFNKIYLLYFSNIHEYLVCFFILSSLLLYINYPKRLYLSLIAFVAGLLTKEVAWSVPLMLFSLSFITKIEKKKLIPFFIVLFAYMVYQLGFFIKGTPVPQNESYQIAFNVNKILSGLIYYLPIPVLLLTAVLIGFQKNIKLVFLPLTILLTLFPMLLFFNRHESYYLYIPFAYLMILLALVTPRLSLKSIALYVIVIFIFGGRSVLPPLTRQNFPNWQKVSMDNVLSKIENDLRQKPDIKEINLSAINIERDARLMLESKTTDLFLPADQTSKYSLVFLPNENLIEVKQTFK